MTPADLVEEIQIELESLETLLAELSSLDKDLRGRAPTVREKTAAAAFLAQFYGGIENILKRITRFYSVPIPSGETWHIELFRRFCEPPFGPLPSLFDEPLAAAFSPYRKFRHVVYHGYGFQMDWDRMAEGVARAEGLYRRFRERLKVFLATFAV